MDQNKAQYQGSSNLISLHPYFGKHLRTAAYKPIVKQIPSYVKDTNHFINKINNFPVPENSFLVTMNAKLLYTSIPNNKGITVIRRKYDNYPQKTIST